MEAAIKFPSDADYSIDGEKIGSIWRIGSHSSRLRPYPTIAIPFTVGGGYC
jgi:hypothetical protein